MYNQNSSPFPSIHDCHSLYKYERGERGKELESTYWTSREVSRGRARWWWNQRNQRRDCRNEGDHCHLSLSLYLSLCVEGTKESDDEATGGYVGGEKVLWYLCCMRFYVFLFWNAVGCWWYCVILLSYMGPFMPFYLFIYLLKYHYKKEITKIYGPRGKFQIKLREFYNRLDYNII